jgi:hypothetical protein
MMIFKPCMVSVITNVAGKNHGSSPFPKEVIAFLNFQVVQNVWDTVNIG